MKVLMINYNRSDACAFYRSSGISVNLSKISGYTVDSIAFDEVIIDWSMLIRYDVVMLQRPHDKNSYDLCQYIKDLHIPLWLDYDDNLFAVPIENEASLTYNGEDTQQRLKEIMALADVITVTTDQLKEALSPYNGNIVVITNAFNQDLFIKQKWEKRSEVVLWRGTKTHIYDLMCMGPQMNELVKNYPMSQFIFMGFYPWFLAGGERVGHMKALDIIIYHKTIQRMLPKIMHVPLHDNNFNRCKSNISAIEGIFAGAMCVVPSWWRIPGTIQYSDPLSYYNAIDAVLSGEVDIQANNEIAWDYVRSELSLTKANIKRMELIREL